MNLSFSQDDLVGVLLLSFEYAQVPEQITKQVALSVFYFRVDDDFLSPLFLRFLIERLGIVGIIMTNIMN